MAIIMIIAMKDSDYPYIPRGLDLDTLLSTRTVMLFGPRQTGKSSYIREQLIDPPAAVFSLLDQGLLRASLADPTRIRQEIEARNIRNAVVVIDEIQKNPALMDEVHLMAFGFSSPAQAPGLSSGRGYHFLAGGEAIGVCTFFRGASCNRTGLIFIAP